MTLVTTGHMISHMITTTGHMILPVMKMGVLITIGLQVVKEGGEDQTIIK